MKLKYKKKYQTDITGHLPKFTVRRVYDVVKHNKSLSKVSVYDNKKSLVTFNLNEDLGLCFEVVE